MSNGTNAVLYAWGLFQPQYSEGLTYEQEVAQVTGSGFTTVILWTLHVRPNGDLVYNDPLSDGSGIVNGGVFNPAYDYMVDLVRALKGPGSKVTKVLFGIGSGGSSDFTNIVALIESGQIGVLQKSFQALANALSFDGFDLDDEDQLPYVPPPPQQPSPSAQAVVNAMAQFTLMLAAIEGTVTYCPYNDQYFWFACLRQVYLANGNQQAVSWFNLQCYAGGTGNTAGGWADQIASYQATYPLGIASPAAFVLPGYWAIHPSDGTNCGPGDASVGMCPDKIEGVFQDLKTTDPGIVGGFIWNSVDVFRCVQNGACKGSPMALANYAQAIIEGLS